MSSVQWVLLSALAGSLAAGCGGSEPARVVRSSYDAFTGRLVMLSADQDGDGRVDQWTYLDGDRPLRGEKDDDGDGRIDRWEYFDAQGQLLMVGTASRGDGIEDTWTYTARVGAENRVDVSTRRDRQADRHDFYVGGILVRSELDTNADGRIDRWDRYDNRVLREVQFDTSFASPRPDRRLLYDAEGRFVAAEADDDRDGRFDRVVNGVTTPPGGTNK